MHWNARSLTLPSALFLHRSKKSKLNPADFGCSQFTHYSFVDTCAFPDTRIKVLNQMVERAQYEYLPKGYVHPPYDFSSIDPKAVFSTKPKEASTMDASKVLAD